ncbi:hypothetical protein [Nocardia sp. NBC_01388]|uniref:hypothetical protein n=1 Tax=Nocardia sp. NBC_01388 TaxID=2903596 RepID=UPI00324ADC2A
MIAEIHIPQTRPRQRRTLGFEALVDEIHGLLTGREPTGPDRLYGAVGAVRAY